MLLSVIARGTPADVADRIASTLRTTLLAPLLSVQHQTELLRSRRTEFEGLIQERDSAIMAARRLEMIDAENARLRSILGLRLRVRQRHVAAEVLHQRTAQAEITLIVTVGRDDGVEQWAPVIAPRGLVGHVQAVGKNTAVVLPWTHPEFRASAATRDGSVTGIVAPRSGREATTLLEWREVPYGATVASGTLIVTTGLGIYPRDIPIGYVQDLVDERRGLSKTYLVEPAVHPAAVSHVLILLGDSSDMSRLFFDPGP